jgi:chemotaxis protein MotB
MKTITGAPTVDTRVNYWPALIDMLTSILMFFLLVFFVEHEFGDASAELAVARQRRVRFDSVFEREFRAEIAAGQIADSARLDRLRIRFGDGVLFETGRYELRPRGEMLLLRLAGVFHEVDAEGTDDLYDQIEIAGHTDDMALDHSTYPHDNWELSTARATSVLRFLTRRVHPPLHENRMSVDGYAHNRPLPGSRRMNRRIELQIYFSGRNGAAAVGP